MGTSPFDDPRVAGQYEDWYASPFGRLADELEQRMLYELTGDLAPGSRLIEIGCGTGHFAAALRARFDTCFVVGIDAAHQMLRRAGDRVPVAQGDATTLPLADASCDVAFVIALLDFVDEPVEVLQEALRVARSHVVMLALVSHSVLALRRRVSGSLGHPIFAAANFYSRRRIEGFVQTAGARIVGRRQALALPPSLAGRLPGLERRLSRANPPMGGILGLRIER